jgi:iron complex outermembrane receptor protein
MQERSVSKHVQSQARASAAWPRRRTPAERRPWLWAILAVAAVVQLRAPVAAAQTLAAQDLKRLSLEELLRVEISTVLRAPEPASAVPAAVFVITPDDIRRSGATSLPEVLRLAPGLQVAQQDAARYAIGIRGFADRLARSMLVLMDGRAVYSPLFAGTYWEVQDTLLEDIERIEIIRGPGGTLWGANAVNGIINIITKRSQDTRGVVASATLGSEARGPVGVRYGGTAGSNGYFRAYAKVFDRDPQSHADDADYDDANMVQGGLRGDWTLSRSPRRTPGRRNPRYVRRRFPASAATGPATRHRLGGRLSGDERADRRRGTDGIPPAGPNRQPVYGLRPG